MGCLPEAIIGSVTYTYMYFIYIVCVCVWVCVCVGVGVCECVCTHTPPHTHTHTSHTYNTDICVCTYTRSLSLCVCTYTRSLSLARSLSRRPTHSRHIHRRQYVDGSCHIYDDNMFTCLTEKDTHSRHIFLEEIHSLTQICLHVSQRKVHIHVTSFTKTYTLSHKDTPMDVTYFFF